MAEVEFRDTQKVYPNGFRAVHGVDLHISDGEFVVLVGPSGCGKSTLLRMVAGLERVTGGEIHIGGQRVNDLEPAERNIAMVFQNYALYPHMTVYDNMAYGLRNRRTPKAEIERRVQEAARILELEALLARKPRLLSGGQRQRVAMGRAIVREPAVFLFDEPLSNLDAKLRVQMRIEIKRLQRSLDTTSIYVTHDQVEAMTMADRLVVINAGVAEQIGSPLEVYERPATRFVAGFIGSPAMNFMEAKLSSDGRRLCLAGDAELELAGKPPDAALGQPVTVGVRPEHLKIDTSGPLGMEVELSEPLGAETLVHGRLAGTGEAITVRLAHTDIQATGALLPLSVDSARLHVFDAESGARLL